MSIGPHSNRPWYVYTLTDPRTHEVRYVGWTTNLERRFYEHIQEARRYARKTHKNNWIRSVVSGGHEPILTIVETGVGEEWQAAEQKWIAFYRAQGCNLTNATDGGNGALRRVFSPETRQKISATKRNRGIPPESLERMAAAHRGKKHSPERIAKASNARRGWKQTADARARIAAAHRGKKMTPEQIEKSAAKRRGQRLTPEHKAKLSAAHQGKKISPATAQRLSEVLSGKPQRCGICGNVGHKRATCPHRQQ